MTTIIAQGYNIKRASNGEANMYLSIPIFYFGIEQSLSVFFKDKTVEQNFKPLPITSVFGRISENRGSLDVFLSDAVQTDLPEAKDWLTFLVRYFTANNIRVIRIDKLLEGYYISTFLEQHYLWCELSKDKRSVRKFEFGRYLPLQTTKYVKKETSWSKGVLTNSNENFIEFRQTSWNGECGDKYCLTYSKENEEHLIKFLAIPFKQGWTELDYRLGENGFYKASIEIKSNIGLQCWSYTLIGIEEQDLPLFGDRLSQLIRTRWADSFVNNGRRHIDRIEVMPIDVRG